MYHERVSLIKRRMGKLMEKKTDISPNKNNSTKFNLHKSREGRILIVALCSILAYCIYLGILFFTSNKLFQIIVGMTATHLVFGRAAGMSFGYTMGLGNEYVLVINMIIETIVVILFYPLFVLSWEKLLVIKQLNNFMAKISKNAEKNRKVIKKYGLFALTLFVFIPFWMTGPLVGAAIGFIIGFSWWLTFISVLGGTYIAIFVWGFLLRELHEKISTYGPFVPLILLGLLVIISIIGHILNKMHKND